MHWVHWRPEVDPGLSDAREVRFVVLAARLVRRGECVFGPTSKDKRGAHYVIPGPRDPGCAAAGFCRVHAHCLVDEAERISHLPTGAWEGDADLRDASIIIELACHDADDAANLSVGGYAMDQIEVLVRLVRGIAGRYSDVTHTRVVGSTDIAYTDCPVGAGPGIPWQLLYQRGIGIWYEELTRQYFAERFAGSLPCRDRLRDEFGRLGYQVRNDLCAKGWRGLVRAFQLRFRPRLINGFMDVETASILYALNERYRR